MKMSGMKVLAVVLLVAAIGFAVWAVSGHTDAYAPAACGFLASAALFARKSALPIFFAQIRRQESEGKNGEDK